MDIMLRRHNLKDTNCYFVIHRFVKYYSEYRPVDGIIASHAGVLRKLVFRPYAPQKASAWEANGMRDII